MKAEQFFSQSFKSNMVFLLKFPGGNLYFGRVRDVMRKSGRAASVYFEMADERGMIDHRGWHNDGDSLNFPDIVWNLGVFQPAKWQKFVNALKR